MTLFSRITGFLRDTSVVFLLGIGVRADAFFIAFRIPAVLNRILGEGAYYSSLVPALAGEDDDEKRSELITGSLVFIIFALFIMTGIILFNAEKILELLYPGLKSVAKTAELLRIMTGYALFLSAGAAFSGFLHIKGRFVPSAAGPMLFNITALTWFFLFKPLVFEDSVRISCGILAGGIIQFLFIFVSAKRSGFIIKFTGLGSVFRTRILTVIKNTAPLALIAVFNQGLFIAAHSVLCLFPQGSIASFDFSLRITEVFMGLVVLPATTIIFPSVSADITSEGKEIHRPDKSLQKGMTVIGCTGVFAGFFFNFFSKDICGLLCKFDIFSASGIRQIAGSLDIVIWAVLILGVYRVIVKVAYAEKRYLPVLFASGAGLVLMIMCSRIINERQDTDYVLVFLLLVVLFRTLVLIPLIIKREFFSLSSFISALLKVALVCFALFLPLSLISTANSVFLIVLKLGSALVPALFALYRVVRNGMSGEQLLPESVNSHKT